MIELIIVLLISLVSIFLITKGADWTTDSIEPVAKKLGTTHIAVGLILVSFIVSLPEIIVAIYTAALGHLSISMGVIVGSIMCNIGLMTGLCAMIKPLKVERATIMRDGVFAVSIAIIVLILSADRQITRAEGFAFILMFIPYFINVWEQEKTKKLGEKKKELEEIEIELKLFGLPLSKRKAGPQTFIMGMALLLGSSFVFSWSLIKTAELAGLSDLLIGITLGAIGPSLPNIAAAIDATVKNLDGVVVAETLGSDIFTLLVTLGVLSMLKPISISSSMLSFDIPVMVIMSSALLIFMIVKQRISRPQGALLLFAYLTVLFINIKNYI